MLKRLPKNIPGQTLCALVHCCLQEPLGNIVSTLLCDKRGFITKLFTHFQNQQNNVAVISKWVKCRITGWFYFECPVKLLVCRWFCRGGTRWARALALLWTCVLTLKRLPRACSRFASCQSRPTLPHELSLVHHPIC